MKESGSMIYPSVRSCEQHAHMLPAIYHHLKTHDAEKAQEELVEVFRKFDKNMDDMIDPDDLVTAFTELGYDCDYQEAQEMILCFDKDGDNSINFSEFVQLMMYDTMDTTLN